MRTDIIVAALLAPAAALAGNNEITVASATRSLPSSSASAVATDDLGGGALGYARELAALAPRLGLWIEGDFAAASTTGTLFQTMTTQIHELALASGARLRYSPIRHLAVAARLDVGAARTQLELDDSAGHAASDSRWSPFARAAAALDLLAIDNRRFAFGLRVELGYVATRGPTLQPTPQNGGDAIKLPTMTSSIGRLDLSGPYVAVGLTTAF
jgi:hypothetical protein